MGFYVVVRGALGVGKTTVATALTSALRGHYLSVDSILDRNGLEEWEDGYVALRSFLRANEILVAEATPLLRDGIPVVVDGNFYFRAQIEDLTRRLPFPHAVFTLKAPLETCLERDRNRPLSLGEQGVRDVFAKVSEVEYGEGIDALRSVAEVVDDIVRRTGLERPSTAGPGG